MPQIFRELRRLNVKCPVTVALRRILLCGEHFVERKARVPLDGGKSPGMHGGVVLLSQDGNTFIHPRGSRGAVAEKPGRRRVADLMSKNIVDVARISIQTDFAERDTTMNGYAHFGGTAVGDGNSGLFCILLFQCRRIEVDTTPIGPRHFVIVRMHPLLLNSLAECFRLSQNFFGDGILQIMNKMKTLARRFFPAIDHRMMCDGAVKFLLRFYSRDLDARPPLLRRNGLSPPHHCPRSHQQRGKKLAQGRTSHNGKPYSGDGAVQEEKSIDGNDGHCSRKKEEKSPGMPSGRTLSAVFMES